MFLKMKRTPILFAVAAAACLFCFTLAQAKKPDNPGGSGGGKGGGEDPLAGTVYFTLGSLPMYTMNPDGSGKTALPANVTRSEPSYDLHGGHRWFLDVRGVDGTYPDGDPRQELFAIRDDGQRVVQLTNEPNLQPFDRLSVPRWSYEVEFDLVDGFVFWTALEWDPETGMVLQAGIYDAAVEFDADGNVAELLAQPDPANPLVPVPVFEFGRDVDGVTRDDWEPDVVGFDRAPDGTALTWARESTHELFVVDLLTNQETLIAVDAFFPAWSPDGSRIAFESFDGIETINPDGNGRTLILNHTRKLTVDSPRWSPDGTHIIFNRKKGSFPNWVFDVYRATAAGGSRTNLTGDTDSLAFTVAWR